MELDQIKRVFETSDYTLADKMLRDGWVLLSVFKKDVSGHPTQPDEKAFYSLGAITSAADPSKYENPSSPYATMLSDGRTSRSTQP